MKALWLATLKGKWHMKKRRWAAALQKQTEKYPARVKKITLICFCLLFAGSNIAVMIHAFTGQMKVVAVHNKMPRIVQAKEQGPLPFISAPEFERIEKFKRRINQLSKASHDSFMLARPKLMDTITQIEQYYQSQK